MLPSVAILCGGRGTRLQEHVPSIPKPLVEIGGRPILWHVMQIYIAQRFTRFLLLTGYKAELIEAFVRETAWPQDVAVSCLDTGVDTPTGGRLRRAAGSISDQRFCATYADGVADIDLHALLEFHRTQQAAATMTVVRPQNPWGVAELDGDRIAGFHEKPPLDCWVNGGFFVMEPRALDHMGADDILEREPLAALAKQGELAAYRHGGFWDCMDTYKDTLLLNELWSQGRAPWRSLVEVGG
ncbi:MAG TPA: sugar phosphate nucleotidyltransferase [Solirubrobacteraceae bacterium]